jgi:hypothetical protein
LLSHSTAFSPEAGLKIAGTVVLVTVTTVEVDGAPAAASEDEDDPPHAVNINKATGTKRFNMMLQILWASQSETGRSADISWSGAS